MQRRVVLAAAIFFITIESANSSALAIVSTAHLVWGSTPCGSGLSRRNLPSDTRLNANTANWEPTQNTAKRLAFHSLFIKYFFAGLHGDTWVTRWVDTDHWPYWCRDWYEVAPTVETRIKIETETGKCFESRSSRTSQVTFSYQILNSLSGKRNIHLMKITCNAGSSTNMILEEFLLQTESFE